MFIPYGRRDTCQSQILHIRLLTDTGHAHSTSPYLWQYLVFLKNTGPSRKEAYDKLILEVHLTQPSEELV